MMVMMWGRGPIMRDWQGGGERRDRRAKGVNTYGFSFQFSMECIALFLQELLIFVEGREIGNIARPWLKHK